MSRTNYEGQAEVLETSRIRLENTKNQPIIAENMVKFGYNEEKMSQGQKFHNAAEEAYNFKKHEDYETTEANTEFKEHRKAINEIYSRHRKIAKAVYEKTPDVLNRLGINGKVSNSYVKWLETVKSFYATAAEEKDIQSKLVAMTITTEELNKQKTDIEQLEHNRADYVRERGESQDATSQKDKAFGDLNDWMREFKAIAKIALEDHPQLLEALHIKA